MSEVNIKTTTDYAKFQLLPTNRDIVPNHASDLEESVKKYPFLLLIQPVLINEHFQIIDGQHHYEVAKRLKMPFAYAQVPNVGIELARLMNIKQTPWGPADYAKSYAAEHNKHYEAYLKFREEYDFNHGTILLFLAGSKARGAHARFKEGVFEINNPDKAHSQLDQVDETRQLLGLPFVTQGFGRALFNALNHKDFDFEHFKNHLREVGKTLYRPAGTVQDYLRIIESIYNL